MILMPYARRLYFGRTADTNNVNEMLVLDFHVDEQWLGCKYLEFDDIPYVRYKKYHVADPRIQPCLPFLNCVLSTGTISKHYYRIFIESLENDRFAVLNLLSEALGTKNANKVIYLIENMGRCLPKSIIWKLRCSIAIQSLKKSPLLTIYELFETIIKIVLYKRLLKNYPP